MFRWPKDSIEFNKGFYQRRYRQKGLTIDLPGLELLDKLKILHFKGTEKDFSEKILILNKFMQKGKVLDFGCSWGYVLYQFRRAGYDAIGFEISKPRAEFGREQLGVI